MQSEPEMKGCALRCASQALRSDLHRRKGKVPFVPWHPQLPRCLSVAEEQQRCASAGWGPSSSGAGPLHGAGSSHSQDSTTHFSCRKRSDAVLQGTQLCRSAREEQGSAGETCGLFAFVKSCPRSHKNLCSTLCAPAWLQPGQTVSVGSALQTPSVFLLGSWEAPNQPGVC